MNKLFFLSAMVWSSMLTFSESTIAQDPKTEWIAMYNSPDSKSDQARKIATDAQGNVYVTGTSDSKNGSFAYICTVKYNSLGKQLWAARYNGQGGSTGNEYPYAIAVDGAGNVYVTGRSMGKNTNLDIATLKYNSSGGLDWAARYNGPSNLNDVPGDVKVDITGNVFVTGYTDRPLTGSGGVIITLKYNSSGTLQWTQPPRFYQSAADGALGLSLALDATGNVYVTGEADGMATIKYNDLGTSANQEWVRITGNIGDRGVKVLLDADNNVIVTGWGLKTLKYNAAGDVIWQAVYTDSYNASAAFWDMALDGSGNVYVTGEYDRSGSSSDYITIRYNAVDGHQQWVKIFNGTQNAVDFARSIALDGSGNVYVTGHCTMSDGSKNGASNYCTIKYDNTVYGNQQWAQFYNGDGFDLATDAAGNLYVTGTSFNKTSSNNYVTIKYVPSAAFNAASASSLQKTPVAMKLQLRNYPNPFSQNTTIEYRINESANVRLSVYDMSAHEIAVLVNEYKQEGNYRVNFNANKLTAGTYFCHLQSGDHIETSKLAVVK